MSIKKLTKELVLENIRTLTEIDSIIKTNEHWEYENFLMELDGKWENSYIALKGKIIAGFIICSIKNESTLHIHRFAVKEEFQNMGVGSQLIKKVIGSTDNKIQRVTLKVKADNNIAQKFYDQFEFKYLYSEDENYVYGRSLN